MHGATLALDPCIPRNWPGFEIAFRYRSARYEIAVKNPHSVCRGVVSVTLDGALMPDSKKALIPLADDGATHRVLLVLGPE